jgi:hypothetical protein
MRLDEIDMVLIPLFLMVMIDDEKVDDEKVDDEEVDDEKLQIEVMFRLEIP